MCIKPNKNYLGKFLCANRRRQTRKVDFLNSPPISTSGKEPENMMMCFLKHCMSAVRSSCSPHAAVDSTSKQYLTIFSEWNPQNLFLTCSLTEKRKDLGGVFSCMQQPWLVVPGLGEPE